MLASHVIRSIESSELATSIGAMIFTAIFPSVLPSIKLSILAPVFSPVRPAIFLTDISTGLGYRDRISSMSSLMLSLFPSTMHRSRPTVE